MNNIKKEAIAALFLLFSIFASINATADEVGCCTNAGAGDRACFNDLVQRDAVCCPKPESNFPGYYKSTQNPNGPANYNDCAANFFFKEKDCGLVDACALGCCCSDLGWQIKPDALCKGTGQVFYKGQTSCDTICEVPQCNNGKDDDNNGCADDKDTACPTPATKVESGGSCLTEGVGCGDANYVPRLSNFQITPVKGQKKFLLKWQDECSQTAVSYDILRCKGSGCTAFALVSVTNINSFEDTSEDLLFDSNYTYQIKAEYSLQTAMPTITNTATLGNIECLNKLSFDNFCIHEPYYTQYRNYLTSNFQTEFSKDFATGVKTKFGYLLNRAFLCDAVNKLVPRGPYPQCTQEQICIVEDNQPSCINKINCNYNSANPFGLYYNLQDCETEGETRYCFYDRSHSTVDVCFNCDTSMACYDYKTEDACKRDNCGVGNCKWKNLANQIGIGVCMSASTYNCQWCETKGTKTLSNIRAFNEVFDLCSEEKSNALSEGQFRCYFRDGKSKNCNEAVCTDYNPEQCGIVTHDENNKITNTVADECSIKACQNFNNACSKNADGNSEPDCTNALCETDYFAPNATLIPLLRKGKVDSLIVKVYDKTSINGSFGLKTSTDYSTFLCVEPCGAQGHPYSSSTRSRTIIMSNLNAFDAGNGAKLLSFNEGTNIIRYYSQDPAKNIGEVKKLAIEVHSNTTGPKVLSVNVTGGSKVLDKIYTSNQNPTIDVIFVEPAVVFFSKLVNKNTGFTLPLQGNAEPNTKVSFPVVPTLGNGTYTFEMNARSKEGISMDPQLSQIIIIDNNKPNLAIEPENGAILNKSLISIKLEFDKEAALNSVKIGSEEIKDRFSSANNKLFTASVNMSDGNKRLEVDASDLAKNNVKKSVEFVVDAIPLSIRLVNPLFGTASKSVFDLGMETDNNAECRHFLDKDFNFEFMEKFVISGGTRHETPDFSKIPSGDSSMHKLFVRCRDGKGITFKSFDINVDPTPPIIKSISAFPNPVAEVPSSTTLAVETDEPALCSYSNTAKDFDAMEGKFEAADGIDFRTIKKKQVPIENEGKFLYFVACKNKAGLVSPTSELMVDVNTTIPISITSYTPPFFNSTTATLAIETNKNAQCQFSETDATARSGDFFGPQGYFHTKNIVSTPGKHTFYVVCMGTKGYSDVKTVEFTIDTTPPVVLWVNDSSTLPNPEFTFSTEALRVKWNSIDNESKVAANYYALMESGSSRIVLNMIPSSANNEWVLVTRNGASLNLTNGNGYFFRVRAQNIVNLISDYRDSDGITIDVSQKPLNCTNGIKDDKETDIDCGGVCGPCKPKATCGDGAVQKPNSAEINEECDKSNLDGKNCNDIDKYKGGNLKCKGDCTFDTSDCDQSENPRCGDNAVNQLSEDCDGQALKGRTCQSFGYNSGTLRCSNCKFDTSSCTDPKPDVCGDGKAQSPNSAGFGEQCDKSDLQQKTCVSFDAYKRGTLVCRSDCTFDYANCELKQPPEKCGDNAVNQLSEDCDNTDFKGSTCLNLGYDSGNLKCTSNCNLDKNSCIVKEYKCIENTDCITGYCMGGLCASPKCDDNLKNQQESDTDCGGSCKKCANNKACNVNADCETGFCSYGTCREPEKCSDGRFSPGESDIDCGGPCPNKCSEGGSCDISGDCSEGLQCASSLCKKCEDNDQNCNDIPDDEEGAAKDTDGDGMSDDFELKNDLNPDDPNDAGLDSDNDGLTNIEEFNVYKTYGSSTDPNLADTDNDGFSDKEEMDRQTSPVDPEDFPKSNLRNILMFTLGIAVLLSGFGYLAYRAVQKRKEQKFGPKPREITRMPAQQQVQLPQKRQEATSAAAKEALKKKEEQREKERERLFEAFRREGKEKPVVEIKKPEQAAKEKRRAPKPKIGKKPGLHPKKKPAKKEDVFIKLKEIAKEAKKKKPKNAKK